MFRIALALLMVFMVSVADAAAPSRPNNYVANTTIDPTAVNANENTLYTYLQVGVDTYADGSIIGDDISNSAAIPYSKLVLTNSITRSDLSSSSFVTLPTGAVFFMVSGSCPTGTTDVSVTYANKYVKINSTAGTSSGTVLTGTTDSHVLDVTEIPAHTHTQTVYAGGDQNGSVASKTNQVGATATPSTSSTGGGLGHTHTLSAATTLEPSSITMKACLVN